MSSVRTALGMGPVNSALTRMLARYEGQPGQPSGRGEASDLVWRQGDLQRKNKPVRSLFGDTPTTWQTLGGS